ncbi:MAG: phage tail protein [Gammaproteobacteria bacterium]|nr:phage tail protein [Gammaproteobacteria bacterium]
MRANQAASHWSDRYLTIPYIDGGRTAAGLDCWGLCREVLHQQFGLPKLDGFGSISPDDKTAITRAYHQIEPQFIESAPIPGAIAAGFKGDLLIHVGIVVESNGLKILHTSSRHGPSKISLRTFYRLFSRVKCYVYNPAYNSSIPE